MSEILLRAWDTVRKEYLSGGKFMLAIQPGETPKPTETYLDVLNCVDMYRSRFIIERHTELYYENGKPIFEGDIVDFRRGQENLFVAMVEGQWVMCTYLQAPAYDYRSLYHYLHHDGPIEKIGNIHKHAHLLREKDFAQAGEVKQDG